MRQDETTKDETRQQKMRQQKMRQDKTTQHNSNNTIQLNTTKDEKGGMKGRGRERETSTSFCRRSSF